MTGLPKSFGEMSFDMVNSAVNLKAHYSDTKRLVLPPRLPLNRWRYITGSSRTRFGRQNNRLRSLAPD